MVYYTPILPIGTFWYGWSANAKVHWIVPILETLVIGLGYPIVIMLAQIYLVDAFGPYVRSDLRFGTSGRLVRPFARMIWSGFFIAGTESYTKSAPQLSRRRSLSYARSIHAEGLLPRLVSYSAPVAMVCIGPSACT